MHVGIVEADKPARLDQARSQNCQKAGSRVAALEG